MVIRLTHQEVAATVLLHNRDVIAQGGNDKMRYFLISHLDLYLICKKISKSKMFIHAFSYFSLRISIIKLYLQSYNYVCFDCLQVDPQLKELLEKCQEKFKCEVVRCRTGRLVKGQEVSVALRSRINASVLNEVRSVLINVLSFYMLNTKCGLFYILLYLCYM